MENRDNKMLPISKVGSIEKTAEVPIGEVIKELAPVIAPPVIMVGTGGLQYYLGEKVTKAKPTSSDKKLSGKLLEANKHVPVVIYPKLEGGGAYVSPTSAAEVRKALKEEGIEVPPHAKHFIILPKGKPTPAVLAHEYGHESRRKTLTAKMYTPSSVVSTLAALAGIPTAELLTLADRRGNAPVKGITGKALRYGALAAPTLLSVPFLAEEGLASKKAIESLKEQGATDKQIDRAKSLLRKAWGTYALQPVILTATGATLGNWAKSKYAKVYEKREFQGIPIKIDRPKGFVLKGKDKEGKEWSTTYRYDYGYIPKTDGGDGEGLDVFIGPDENAKEMYWAMKPKEDGSFDEYKTFLGFPSEAAALKAYKEHIPHRPINDLVAMRVSFFKSILGEKAHGLEKAAQVASFLNEIDKLAQNVYPAVVDPEKVKEKALEALEAYKTLTPKGIKTRLVEAAKELTAEADKQIPKILPKVEVPVESHV